MIKAPWQGGGKKWGLIAIALSVMILAWFFYFRGNGQKPGGIPAEILSTIDQEKARAQRDFADFIQTPGGKLWQKYPYWDPAICQKIAEGQVFPGMSKEQTREAVARVVEIRKQKGEKRWEEWVVENKRKEMMILRFDENLLLSVEPK